MKQHSHVGLISLKFFFFFFLATLFIFLFIYLFIYLFGCVGSSVRARAFSGYGKWGPLFIAVRGPLFIAVRGPFTIAAPPVAGRRLQTRRLSSCGSRAQPLRGMWDLPRPGLEPVSPASAGRLPTTAPPGKPLPQVFKQNKMNITYKIEVSFDNQHKPLFIQSPRQSLSSVCDIPFLCTFFHFSLHMQTCTIYYSWSVL